MLEKHESQVQGDGKTRIVLVEEKEVKIMTLEKIVII